MTEMIKFVVAKVAASVWSIEQASSIQATSPFSCSSPFSLSLVTLWRQKGQSEDGWPKKTLVHRRVTGATASKPGRGRPLPPQGRRRAVESRASRDALAACPIGGACLAVCSCGTRFGHPRAGACTTTRHAYPRNYSMNTWIRIFNWANCGGRARPDA